MYLLDQRLQGREMLLVTQLRHELHFDLPAIEVRRKIEHVHLEQRVQPSNSGARTQACNTTQRHFLHTTHTDRKNTVQRRPATLNAQVRCRKTQVPPESLAGDDAAAHRIGPAEPPLHELEIATSERLAQATAADALAVQHYRRHDVDRKAQPPSGIGQHGCGRLTMTSEPEVMPDNHGASPYVPRQKSSESLTPKITQALAKAQQQNRVETHPRQDSPTLAKRGEPRGRRLGVQVLAWHRLERQ